MYPNFTDYLPNIVPEESLLQEIAAYKNSYPKPLNIFIDSNGSQSSVEFNVLPGKKIQEKIIVKEYRLKKRFIEAKFDRKYFSEMAKSPNHLIFLSSLIQLQKMNYIYLCYEFKHPIAINGKERLKIWPTNINIDMPKMITKRNNLSQQIKIKNLRKLNKNSYFGKCESVIENVVSLSADAMISII